MSYASPLSLLSDQQIANFKPEHVKKIRSELLLQFQLSEDPTIIIDHVPYDKDEIISLLDQLQEDPELHLEIFNNKSLLHFLEEGKIEFFKDKVAQDKVLQHPTRSRELETLVVDTLNLVLPDWIEPFGQETADLLADVNGFVNKLDTSLQELAYSATYERINTIVDILKTNYSEPFTYPGSYSFKVELTKFVNREFITYFKHLPKAFDNLLRKYRLWCYGLVAAFVQRQEPMSRYDTWTLHVVMDAATIAADQNDRETNLKIAEQIETFLAADPVRKKSRSGWFTALLLIVGIIKVVAFCGRQDRYKTHNYYLGTNNYNKEMYNHTGSTNYYTMDRPSEATNRLSNQQGSTTKKNKISPSRFNGSAPKKDGYFALLDMKETPERTILTYEAEIIPSRVGEFDAFVPDIVRKNHPGQQWDITLIFQKKGLPEVRFSHKVKMDYRVGHKLIGSPAIVVSGKPVVKVVARSYDNYKFKGFLTRMDSLGKITLQDSITIWQRESSTSPFMKYNGEFVNTGSDQSHKDYRIEARMNCMLHNVDILNNKELFSGAGNEIQDVWRYELKTKLNQDKTQPPDVLISTLLTEQSTLYFLFKSAKDNVAYFTILQGASDFKYMFDSSTGLIKGLQVATCSDDGSVLERIELFSVE